MGGLCSSSNGKTDPISPEPGKEPKKKPEPPGKQIYDYIIRGNFIPQQNGDLKVKEGDVARVLERSADDTWVKVELESNLILR